jgi:hypothetical protein
VRLSALLLFALSLHAQLPDPADLLAEVKANQHRLDQIREDYTFHMLRKTHELDKKGAVVKSASVEREVFFVNGRRIARLVARDGKPISPAQDKAEQERVQKLVENVLKGGRGGGPRPGARVGEISDILAVVKISNPRRVTLNHRPSLAYDFSGDPKAHSHDMEQSAAKKLSGTIWFDEADHQVARLEVYFDDTFHIGGGILASVQKGSSMEFEQAPVGDGLWMQTSSAEHLDARFVVKKLREDVHVTDYDFKKFNTGVIQQATAPSK